MAQILLGKEVTASLNEEIEEKVKTLKEHQVMPKLGIIRIGEKQDDIAYERNAIKRCEKLSVAYEKFLLPEDVTEEMVIDTIQKLNKAEDIHGVLVFRPLPSHLDENLKYIGCRKGRRWNYQSFHGRYICRKRDGLCAVYRKCMYQDTGPLWN